MPTREEWLAARRARFAMGGPVPKGRPLIHAADKTITFEGRGDEVGKQLEVKVLVDSHFRPQYLEYPSGQREFVGDTYTSDQKVVPLGTVRTRVDRDRGGRPNEVERIEITAQQLEMAEILAPGAAHRMRKLFGLRLRDRGPEA